MINVRLKLILAGVGARGDFVAGWTGLLPNVIDNCWTIDPITGGSSGTFHLRAIGSVNQVQYSTFEQLFSQHNLILDPTSKLCYVGPMHGFNLDLNTITQLCDTGAVDVYYIDIRNVDYSVIHWEFIVKTYLTKHNTISDILNHRVWKIDGYINQPLEDITDNHRILAVKQQFAHHHIDDKLMLEDKFLNNKNVTVLDYQKLFRPGGSMYLCDKMKLSADAAHHMMWDTMLLIANSRESINAFGYTWNKQDFN
jgi:hypothetical protein